MVVIARERLDAGMRRQFDALSKALDEGMAPLGWKVGINVPEVQASLGLTHSTVGWLDGRSVHEGGAVIRGATGQALHVEPELALRVAQVPRNAARENSKPRVDAVAAAFEIVDYARPADSLDDLLAHSMFHAGLILGPFRPLPLPTDAGVTWPRLFVNDAEAGVCRRDLVDAEPDAIADFVATYLEAFGTHLHPGSILLSGSFFARAAPLRAGATVTGRFGALGDLSFAVA